MRGIRVGVERPAGPRREGQIVRKAQGQALDPGPGDHRAIIGAKRSRRQDELQARFAGKALKSPPDPAVGRGAACDHKRQGRSPDALTKRFQPGAAAIDDRIDDGRLERGAEIGDICRRQRRDSFGFEPHRRLEAGKREIRLGAAEHGARKIKPQRIAFSASCSTCGPPG